MIIFALANKIKKQSLKVLNIMAKLTFNELRKKFGFTAKRTKAYRVLDEFGANITSRVKVMTMAGGLFAIDEFGIDITNQVKFERI